MKICYNELKKFLGEECSEFYLFARGKLGESITIASHEDGTYSVVEVKDSKQSDLLFMSFLHHMFDRAYSMINKGVLK